MGELNRLYGTTASFATEQLKKLIVKQLLKLLNINVLAALTMAYAVADKKSGS